MLTLFEPADGDILGPLSIPKGEAGSFAVRNRSGAHIALEVNLSASPRWLRIQDIYEDFAGDLVGPGMFRLIRLEQGPVIWGMASWPVEDYKHVGQKSKEGRQRREKIAKLLSQ